MPDARPNPTGPGGPARGPDPTTRDAADAEHVPGPLPNERLARLADLVADGEAGVPGGLEPADELRLETMVRDRLRARLVRFIARQVALDIHRDAGRGGE